MVLRCKLPKHRKDGGKNCTIRIIEKAKNWRKKYKHFVLFFYLLHEGWRSVWYFICNLFGAVVVLAQMVVNELVNITSEFECELLIIFFGFVVFILLFFLES